MKSNKELVLKINEIFHDITAFNYDKKHSNVFFDEYHRWQNFGIKYLINNSNNIKLLDIGTGTGFVPMTIAGFLKKGDFFYCSDISSNILERCRDKLKKIDFKCNFEFLKVNGSDINLRSESFNFVTLNSVLHHIPDFSQFFKEVNRLLKPNGYLVIGHEPNKNFVENKFLFNNFRLITLIFNRKRILPTIFRKIKSHKTAKYFENIFKIKPTVTIDTIKKINNQLLELKITNRVLTLEEISKMVDFHSPTAAGYRFGKGIDIKSVSNKYLSNFDIVYFETYNHLGKATNKNYFTRFYSSILKRIFPQRGGSFFIILKKKVN
ncbi:MAG: class I SAM-dependent methyltransferase [Candidatus Thorarchaeota archaeon]